MHACINLREIVEMAGPTASGPHRFGRGSPAMARLANVGVLVVFLAFILAVPHLPTSQAQGDAQPIRVTSTTLIVDPASGQPRVVLSLYEDFLCPYCGKFERYFSATVDQLIDAGAVAADYYMLNLLDLGGDRNYSSRAGAATYCVANQSIDAFRQFHATLFANQPYELAATFPDDLQLIAEAKQAGGNDSVADCVNRGDYLLFEKGLAQATGITTVPTIRLNGQNYTLTTPDALVASVEAVVGTIPGLSAVPPPSPTVTQEQQDDGVNQAVPGPCGVTDRVPQPG
jgi:protein-disulfide isomerase